MAVLDHHMIVVLVWNCDVLCAPGPRASRNSHMLRGTAASQLRVTRMSGACTHQAMLQSMLQLVADPRFTLNLRPSGSLWRPVILKCRS